MPPSKKELESSVIALAEKSFQTFCDDISGMFGIDMACTPQNVTPETVNGLQTRFKDLAVVYSVRAEGPLDCTFQLVVDRQGLFILAGVVAMHPEQMIMEDAQFGSLEKAQKAGNVIKEIGAALAGSWDRVFRKELDGHGRLTQTNTFIGNPWDNSKEKIGLAGDEELMFIPYEMTVNSYPTFMCGTIFPKAVLTGTSEPVAEKLASDEETTKEEVEEKTQEDTDEKAEEKTQEKTQQESEEKAQEEIEEKDQKSESAEPKPQEPETEEAVAAEQPDTEGDSKEATEPAAEQAQQADEEAVIEDENTARQETQEPEQQIPADLEEVEAATDESDESKERPVTDAIQKMTQSLGVFPEETTSQAVGENSAISGTQANLNLYAKDIMQTNIVWGSPDDSVQQAFTKIQQHDAGYMMIGNGQVPEGIVSKSDLTGALSPYLRPTFDKWRRPMDEATLQIRVKWIMSKPVSTISPDTPITTIMENMSRTGKRCLPVADEQGSVQGLVTVFDTFKVLLKNSSNI
jgi:CBS domain-containing protein